MIYVSWGYSSTYFDFYYAEFKYDDFLTACFHYFVSSTLFVFILSQDVDPYLDVILGGAGDDDVYHADFTMGHTV